MQWPASCPTSKRGSSLASEAGNWQKRGSLPWLLPANCGGCLKRILASAGCGYVSGHGWGVELGQICTKVGTCVSIDPTLTLTLMTGTLSSLATLLFSCL